MSELYDSSKTKAYAELHICGESVFPNEISAMLGLLPSSSNEVGEMWGLANKPHTVASWVYKTEEKSLTEDFSEPLYYT